jgi:hypothetical protein
VNVYHHWGDHVRTARNHFIDRGNVRGGRFGGSNVCRRDGQGHWQEQDSRADLTAADSLAASTAAGDLRAGFMVATVGTEVAATADSS